MARIVLVHGAFHGGWCWGRLAPLLAGRGHEPVAPDLPGLGADPTPPGTVTLADNVDRVVAAIGTEGAPVMLVGHSLGGMTISAVAERIPDRIALLVYLTAFLPRDGESIQSIGAAYPQFRPDGPPPFALAADKATVEVTAETARALFFNDCAEAEAMAAVAQLRPQPAAVRTAPVALTPERFGRVPRAYVECVGDASIPVAFQRAMAANSPCAVTVSLPGGHSPFLSIPERLAEALDGLTGRIDARPSIAVGG